MPNLSGSRSSFYESQTLDDFNERYKNERITSEEWNHLGDGIYDLERSLTDLADQEKNFRLNPYTYMWAENLPITWYLSAPHQLSATGVVMIPSGACEALGTDYPLYEGFLVKAQVIMDNPVLPANANITSAVWAPSNWRDKYGYMSSEEKLAAGYSPMQIAFSKIPRPASHSIWRTLYVGLYFDGMEAPQDLNSLGISLSVMIMGYDL